MRTTIQVLLTGAALLAAPAVASADVAHTVQPGESLWSVAAQDGLTVDQLAAANGISSSAGLQAGATLTIPPQSAAPVSSSAPAESSSSVVSSAPATGGSYVVQSGDTLSGIAAASGMTVDELAAANGLDPRGLLLAGTRLNLSGSSSSASVPASEGGSASSAPAAGGGSYVVQPGDTLWGIATANGMTVDQLAAANGLDPRGLLLAGTTLNISGASAGSAAAPTSVTTTSSAAPAGGAQPTPETVSPADVGQVAAANGVSSSLAEAVADQESGFNNNAVSSTGAVGVMQIEPYTWTFIGHNLAPTPPLSPNSAQDNIRGGVLLLRSLLAQTDGDPGLAAASYYQGLGSVREHGLLPSTRRYVANVLALEHRFGGP